ncbi:MAG: phosphate transport system regulatory protein PhoU [Deltaproteobacteria bacterium]|nr:MAG: phosphate transport system regulatory protein PhoU [Deltaproteobacteria bacterium]
MTDKRHTDSEYEAELQRVRENVLHMVGLVEDMIRDAVRSFVDRDTALAVETVRMDQQVNRLEMETDDLCLVILAKRQPMASDLRFITLSMKMVTDIERIGDLAVNVCERTLALAELGDTRPIPDTIPRMADIARSMVRDAIDAFVNRDAAKAQDVWDRDSQLDELYLELCTATQARMSDDPALVQRGMHVQAVAKFLERIGDHATNLAEMVVFMVKGEDMRHIGKR